MFEWYDSEPDYEGAILARQEWRDIDEDNQNVDFDDYDDFVSPFGWIEKIVSE